MVQAAAPHIPLWEKHSGGRPTCTKRLRQCDTLGHICLPGRQAPQDERRAARRTAAEHCFSGRANSTANHVRSNRAAVRTRLRTRPHPTCARTLEVGLLLTWRRAISNPAVGGQDALRPVSSSTWASSGYGGTRVRRMNTCLPPLSKTGDGWRVIFLSRSWARGDPVGRAEPAGEHD